MQGIYNEPLVYIFNLSFKLGKFPDNLIICKIKPLLKNGNTIKMEYYRPVGLLPFVS